MLVTDRGQSTFTSVCLVEGSPRHQVTLGNVQGRTWVVLYGKDASVGGGPGA